MKEIARSHTDGEQLRPVLSFLSTGSPTKSSGGPFQVQYQWVKAYRKSLYLGAHSAPHISL